MKPAPCLYIILAYIFIRCTFTNITQPSTTQPSRTPVSIDFRKPSATILSIHTRSIKSPGRPQQNTSVALLALLLGGDIELNPGPNDSTITPCGFCQSKVDWDDRALGCDNKECQVWFHKTCLEMCSTEYNRLEQEGSKCAWICNHCDVPNYSSTLFRHYELELSNSFTILGEPNTTNEISSPGSVFHPGTTSSPLYHHSRTSNKSSTGSKSSTVSSTSSSNLPNKRKNWRSLIVNINGLRNKSSNLQNVVDYTRPDVIIACETKITDKVYNAEVIPIGYQKDVFRKNRSDRGGGVLLAFREGFVVSKVDTPKHESESVWAQVSIPGQTPLYVCSFYRPPASGSNPLKDLEKDIQAINKKGNKHLIVAGDFNCGHINWETSVVNPGATEAPAHRELLDILNRNMLTNTQLSPTREERNLDLHITTRPSLVKAQRTIPGISDHDIVVIDSDIRPVFKPQQPRKIYSFKRAEWDEIRSETRSFCAEFLATSKDNTVDTNWLAFKSHLQTMLVKHIPSKLKSTRHNIPWLTQELKRQTRKKQRLYNKARKTKKKEAWDAYKHFKKHLQRTIQTAHRNYIDQTLSTAFAEGNNRPFWKYVKNQKKDASGVAPLKKQGDLYSGSKEKAEILGEQFSSVFTKDRQDEIPKMQSRPSPTIATLEVTEPGVAKLLSKIVTTKASGPDEIPNLLLKELSQEIAPILTFIFNQTLQQGCVPQDWKEANIAPIYKKDDKHLASNYRPISLTCVCSKLMEHIVVHHLMDHLDRHNILTDLQHGFRRKRSCVTQLLTTTSDLAKHHNNNTQVDINILDFSKAFDVVSHRKLLAKLTHYGVCGPIHSWIQSFLTDRTQKVVIEGTSSGTAKVLSGVPQGTCLGPILFLCYINDIADGIQSQLRLFADDALLYRPIKSLDDHLILQKDLKHLEAWADKWDMKFNAKKCYVISAKRSGTKSQFRYDLCQHVLKEVATNPYLGVLLSNDGSFTPHIDSTCAKVSRTLGFLSRNLKACPEKLKTLAFNSMCRSSLEYAAQIWDPQQITVKEKLDKIQRRGARFVTRNYSRSIRGEQIVKDLKWEDLSTRRKHSRLILFYQIINNQVAIPFVESQFIVPGSRGRFHTLSYNHTGYEHSYYPQTIRDWNSLPDKTRNSPSLETFKSRLGEPCR